MLHLRNKLTQNQHSPIKHHLMKTITTNGRQHTKSIHQLNPSCMKSMTPKTSNRNIFNPSFNTTTQSNLYISNNLTSSNRYRDRSYESEDKRKYGIVQSLFTDERIVLEKLEKQAQSLKKQKQSVIRNNQKQYQIVVEKMMEMRRNCNKRRQDIQSLKKQLRLLQTENVYKNVKDFTWKRQSQYDRQCLIYQNSYKNSKLEQQKRNRQTLNLINNKLNI